MKRQQKAQKLSNMKRVVLSTLASVAHKSAERSANQTCFWLDYQPALPQKVQTLKNHK